jgi:periplasmic protein TonB
VTIPPHCRGCTGLAILGSAAVHAALAAALWWPVAGQAPADPGVHEVAVTLAMFGGGEPAAGQPAEAPVPEPPPMAQPAEPEPEADPEADPEPVVQAPQEHLPEPEPIPSPAPEVQPEPPPPPLAETRPEPKVKPKAKHVPKPKPKRPAPDEAPRVAQARPAPIPAPAPAAARAQPTSATAAAAGLPTAAAAGAGGTGDAAGIAAQEGAYLKGLTQAIALNRFYPPAAQRQEVTGVVLVAFTIQADGTLGDFRVAKGSGSEVIDQAAVETVRRLGSYKPIPAGIGRSRWPVRVPIRFDLR